MAGGVSFGRRLLNGWMAVSGRFAFVQTLMLLVFLYVFLIGPVWTLTLIARADEAREHRQAGPGA